MHFSNYLDILGSSKRRYITRVFSIFFIYLLVSFFRLSNSTATVFVDLPVNTVSPLSLAIKIDSSYITKKDALDIKNAIYSDLTSTRLFRSRKDLNNDLSEYDFYSSGNPEEFIRKLTFKSDLDYFLDINIEKEGSNNYVVTGKLISVEERRIIFSQKHIFKEINTSKIAHIVADRIMMDLFGYYEHFDSKILYVVDSQKIKHNSKGTKRIAIINRDGSELSYLNNFSMVMKPSYSNKRKEVFYVTYEGGETRVKIVNVNNGKTIDLGDLVPGIKGKKTISPQISKDGSKILFSMNTENHNFNIYLYQSKVNKITRLTNKGINISPSFAPDDNAFVFASDMKGNTAIYKSQINNKKAKKISKEKGSYYEPKWSPNGDLIVFIKTLKGRFYLGIMNSNGSNEKILYSGHIIESPSWSPSGKSIVFSYADNKKDKMGLKIVDIDGRELLELKSEADLLDPFWFLI